MSDDRRDRQDDDQELTFESGYGAKDNVLKDDETLEDVAGVSEEDIRNDVKRTHEVEDADSSGEA